MPGCVGECPTAGLVSGWNIDHDVRACCARVSTCILAILRGWWCVVESLRVVGVGVGHVVGS